jgi:hypothetical protein
MLKRLQKVDQDTNDLIAEIQKFLFSVGVRTSKERAWEIFKACYKIPFEMLIERNDTIEYQGQGVHLSSRHDKQRLVIKDIGKFELKGVSMKKDAKKTAAVKFVPSYDIKNMAAKVKVI